MSSRKELNQDPLFESHPTPARTITTPTGSEVSERLLTDRDVCSITGLDRVTLYRLRNANKIGFYKFGTASRNNKPAAYSYRLWVPRLDDGNPPISPESRRFRF